MYQAAVGGYRYYRYCEERTYKASQFLHFGDKARIGDDVLIYAPERCYIGDSAGISPRCLINAVGGFHLGNYSVLANECLVLTTEHRFMRATSLPFDRVRQVKPVHIGDYVWLGARAMILSGVRIGDGAIVGMGSVVAQDVPPLCIVSGNPGKIIGKRSPEVFEKLRSQKCRREHPFEQCSVLWVPPFTQSKYSDELKRFGFEVVPGEEYFLYDKFKGTLVRIENTKALEMSKAGADREEVLTPQSDLILDL
jgi:acetyltransferase-like isoleucine patch superfamily enzyme